MENTSDNTQALPTGTRIEEFIVERVLGSGGFGITYLARDTGLNRHVVIKENLPAQFAWRETTTGTVRPRHSSGGDADDYQWSMNNFLREAETLASLDHPGIVRVLRKFEANGTAYFVMPYVDGLALDTLIEDRGKKGNPFSEEELRGLLEHVLGALAYLHDRGIYHRDIKPGNILISNDGVPALIDFGSARQRLSERSMTVVESAGYTPFEQLQTRGNVGPWSDLYALGGTLAKAITGHAPPKANDRMIDDPWQGLANHPKAKLRYSKYLLASIDKALEVNAAKRWRSAEEWREALVAEQAGEAMASTQDRPYQTFPAPIADPVDESAGEQMALPSAGIEQEFMDDPEPRKSMPPVRRSKRELEALGAVLAVVVLVGWAIRAGSDGNPAADETAKGELQPQSPFLAATEKPSAWLKMAEAGDPLAQALLGDALYWGGQIRHGIEKDPSAGVKWIEKSSSAAHPLGKFLMGLLKDQGGKLVPFDEESAKLDYVQAVGLGLVRDAENGGPVWWTALAQALERGKGVDPDSVAAVGWYRRAAEAGYVDGMNGLAECYVDGVGVAKDEAEAAKWIRKAAEAGDAKGMSRLGLCYSDGIGVAKDATAAADWLQKAADAGDPYGMAMFGLVNYYGVGVSKNHSEAVKWFRLAADFGEATAQTRLGICYADGEGVPKDLSQAVKWYQKAADQGNAEAQILLGAAYEFGDGVTESATMAAKWYRKAAEQGDPEGQCNLGDLYLNGEGVPQDAKEAVKWYRKAAEQEDPTAQNALGECYQNGVGVSKDPGGAFEWFKRAAESGDAAAQYNLALCYDSGEGVAENDEEAVKWLMKSAQQGYANAQVIMGVCYTSGAGVDADPEEAIKWYIKAAYQNHSLAHVLLGDCYANGEGVPQDHEKAVMWYRKAADVDFPAGQHRLGLCFHGGNGVAKNTVEAVKWFKLAAEQEYAQAQNDLGYCYENGEGVPKDPVEAVKWYRKAAEQGSAAAQHNLGQCYAYGHGVPANDTIALKWLRSAQAAGADCQADIDEIIMRTGADTPSDKGKPAEPARADYPFATKVPQKEGFVLSPYNNKLVDVRNVPSGTLMQDPTYPASEKKYFRVP
jgi:TPR repeat protein/serine/threonine protein kinase